MKGETEVGSVKKQVRYLLICLITALAVTVAIAPVLHTESSVVWAKSKSSKKKKSTKSSKKKKKKKTKKKKKKAKIGFVKVNGNWYYYENGKKKTGWFDVNGRRFYALKKPSSKKGRLVQGWFKPGKKEFWFRTDGKKGEACALAVSGVFEVNGIDCVFDENGSLVRCKHAGKKDGFVNTVGELARMNQARNNILASLVVAQACLETGYGGNIYYNNLFGIRQGTGYRKYDSWEKSIEDYVNFMHTYIPRIFGVRDPYTACSIIGSAGYAEAGGYGGALSSIVSSQNLTRFNR